MSTVRQSRGTGPDSLPSGAILAIDYGRVRIGLALAESADAAPQPLGTLDRVNRNEDMRRLRELARDYGVRQIVVGLPLRLDGSAGDMAEEARRFAARVGKQISLPVQLVDERLTSWEAERVMEDEFGRKSKVTSGASNKKASSAKGAERISVDSVAATIILREYLEGRVKTAPEAG